jgi:hypothetical protein
MVTKHPVSVLDSYATNYLATSNFYDYGVSYNGQWAPEKKIGLYGHENKSIGLLFLTYPFNMSNWTSDNGASKMGLVQVANEHNGLRSLLFNIFGKPYLALYIVVSIMLPILFMVVLFLYKKLRRRQEDAVWIRLFEMTIILLGFGLFNVLFNVFFGSLMDRYAYVGWPCISLALILLVVYVVQHVHKDIKKSSVKIR